MSFLWQKFAVNDSLILEQNIIIIFHFYQYVVVVQLKWFYFLF